MTRRMADPEALQAAVHLMELQCLRHGVQYAPVGHWSFRGRVGLLLRTPAVSMG